MSFPIFLIESKSMTGSFQGLNNSVAQSPGELWWKVLAAILHQNFCARGT